MSKTLREAAAIAWETLGATSTPEERRAASVALAQQDEPTDEQIAELAWRIGMGPAIVAGSDVVAFARTVLALRGAI